MKNALLLLSVWVGIIVAAYAMVYWDRGIEQPLPEEDIIMTALVHRN